jgi:hypothetical protein
MTQMRNILDKRFKYVPAAKTDIRKTFRRERERLAAEAAAREQEQREKVAPIKARGARP